METEKRLFLPDELEWRLLNEARRLAREGCIAALPYLLGYKRGWLECERRRR